MCSSASGESGRSLPIAEVARRGLPVGSSSNATKVLTLSPQLIEES